LGTILDVFSLKRWRRSDAASPSEGWRRVKYFLLVTILAAAFFGNMSLLVLDPITILLRTLSTAIWPAFDRIITAAESTLYQVPGLAKTVMELDTWLRPGILPSSPVYSRNSFLFLSIFLGIIALNLLKPRFWCRYLCPLGGLLGLLSKFALIQRVVGEGCKGCRLCTADCPTGTIDSDKDYASDPGECTMCLDCFESCPQEGIALKARIPRPQWQEYDPGRRDFLAALGTTIAGLALFRVGAGTFRQPKHLLRPPGINPEDFLSTCIRCAECIQACPTGGLQPSVTDAGLEGLWTPVLVPRIGYCDYSCNACGQICPTEAIPPLTLEQKREMVIGKAYINTDRCIPWADNEGCIVCEEMCPIPDKAIYLEEIEILNDDGEMAILQLPHVDRELCIGCGVCEFKCPLDGEAAIRVYVSSSSNS
jgi:MauM/NapG family ferredoxin protein